MRRAGDIRRAEAEQDCRRVAPLHPDQWAITRKDDRGFYAGAVGWCDQRGDGRWVVSIRCAQLSADRRTAYAYAGGGIVAESEPDDEVDETTTKFNTMFAALGVEP